MNYYKVLGVAQNADADAIQSAYYALVQKYHPDINPDGGEKFKQINKAYETLRDPKKRGEYNATLSGAAATTGSVGPKRTTTTGPKPPPTSGGPMPGGLGDILDNMRGRTQTKSPPASAGTTPTVKISLTMSELMRGGGERPIIVNGKKILVRVCVED